MGAVARMKDARTIDFAEVLKTLYGENMKGDGDVDLTLGRCCLMALDNAAQGEPSASAEEKINRYLIGVKIFEAERDKRSIALSAEEVALVKKRIGMIFVNAFVVGAAMAMLDPASVPAPAPKLDS